jgi:hypothetical protein
MNIAKLPELVGRKRPEMKNALARVPSISAYYHLRDGSRDV